MVNNHKNFAVKTDTKSLARSIIQVIEISKKHDPLIHIENMNNLYNECLNKPK